MDTTVLSLFFFIIVFLEIVYFHGMKNYNNMTIFDMLFVLAFNIGFIVLISYDVPQLHNPEKPRSEFIALGSSLQDTSWALFYDYHVIVDRFDRNKIKVN